MAIEQVWKYGETNPNDFIVTLRGDTLTYSGNGEIKGGIENENTPWYPYRNHIRTMVLQNSDEELNNRTQFGFYKNLEVINISHNVTCNIFAGELDENDNMIEINVDRNNLQYCSINGVLYDKNQSTLIYCPQKTKAKEIKIPSTVKKIDGCAFSNCRDIYSVTIPENVKEIAFSAFAGCSSLSNIDIQNGVKLIGNAAFGGCSSLSNVVIPNSVETICSAFRECNNLSSITIPNGVMLLGNSFPSCSKLTNIHIVKTSFDSKTYLEDGVLYSTIKIENKLLLSLSKALPTRINKHITIPDNVQLIEDEAFANCSNLQSVTFPDKLKSILGKAFANCNNLTSVVIPQGVEHIGYNAFLNCRNLISVKLPDGIKTIENKVFENCPYLKKVTIGRKTIDISLFEMYH